MDPNELPSKLRAEAKLLDDLDLGDPESSEVAWAQNVTKHKAAAMLEIAAARIDDLQRERATPIKEFKVLLENLTQDENKQEQPSTTVEGQ